MKRNQEFEDEIPKKIQKKVTITKIIIEGSVYVKVLKDIVFTCGKKIELETHGNTLNVKELVNYESPDVKRNKMELNGIGDKRIIIEGYDVTVEINNIIKEKKMLDVIEDVEYDASEIDLNISDIETCDSSELDICPDVIDKKRLRISTYANSNVKIDGLGCEIGIITTSGKSGVFGSMTFGSADLFSSGDSHIEGVLCKERLDAVSKGNSTIDVEIQNKCYIRTDIGQTSTIVMKKIE
jgi:hypothetical protein